MDTSDSHRKVEVVVPTPRAAWRPALEGALGYEREGTPGHGWRGGGNKK